jgi:hypothetical protein
MTTFSWVGPVSPGRDLLDELSGGHAAAARFAVGAIGEHSLGFEATLLPDGSWPVVLNAC